MKVVLRRTTAVLLLFLAPAIASLSCQSNTQAPNSVEDEEYRVIEAALKYLKYQRMQDLREPLVLTDPITGAVDTFKTTRARKPLEFYLAPDTTEARSIYNQMLYIYGDLSYYFTIRAKTLARDDNPMLIFSQERLQWQKPEIQDLYGKSADQREFVRDKFGDSLIVRLISDSEFTSAEQMYAALPLTDGRIQLSRVGFSPDRKFAAVFHRRRIYRIGGSDLMAYLKKTGEKWEVYDIDVGITYTGGW